MPKINQIQNAILELDGGSYQKLLDKYLYKRFGFTNIMPYGSQTGTNKTTKGIPDSYVRTENGKYILIMYGTVEASPYKKVEKDIIDCLNPQKTKIEIDEIDKIICCYTSTNISIDEHKALLSHFKSTMLINLGELSQDLYFYYPNIAKDDLSIDIDTHQILNDKDFVEENDRNEFSTSLDMNLLCRENEKSDLLQLLEEYQVILISGKSGFGKTRLALEVARKYCDTNDAEIKIIKSNGEPIYNDLKAYFLTEKSFVVIVDDANKLTQLHHLLNICMEPNRKNKFKIILTVRDYAREDILKKIKEVLLPSIYNLGSLDNTSIKEILNKNLNIIDPIYIEQILKIAKGNIRLAIMAGTCSKIGSFESILNAFDIFDLYFDSIINQMDGNEILTAAIIAFFDTIKLDINQKAYDIALDLGISNDDFSEYAIKLHKKEVVDIFNDLALKFNNQNLSDYLLYYVFFKNRWISLSEIIIKIFLEYKGRIIYVVSTLIQLFYSKENMEFIRNEIKKAWYEIKDKDYRTQAEFMELFYVLMEDESLLYIKKSIDNLPEVHVDFLTYDFNKTRNNHKIDSKLLHMLVGFKNTKSFQDAVQLIFKYLEKNTENPMDFYFTFNEKIGIDKNSFNRNYELENVLLCQIMGYYEEKKTIEAAYCLLFYLYSCLKFAYSVTEGSYPNQYLTYIFGIVPCDSSVRLRTKSIQMLSKLYLIPELQKNVIEMLMKYPENCSGKDNVKVVKNDLIAFHNYFREIFDYNNFNECILMNHFYEVCKRNCIGKFSGFLHYINNKTFTLYINIKGEKYRRNHPNEEGGKKRLQKITKLGLKMTVDDFIKLFDALQNDTVDNAYDWDIGTGISILINSISREPTKFIEVVKEYLKHNTPFLLYTELERIIEKMINSIGYIKTKKIIKMYDYKKKNLWVSTLYNLIQENEISSKICDDMIKHLIDQKELDNIYAITLNNAFKINNIQRDFLIRYIEVINNEFKKKPWVSAQILNSYRGNEKEAYKNLIYIFSKKIYILQEAYLLAIEGRKFFDSEGKFFGELVSQDINFIDKMVFKVVNNNLEHDRNVLPTLWKSSNYKELIDIAVNSIRKYCQYSFLTKNIIMSLFYIQNRNENIVSKQEKWIMNYIDINYSNEDTIEEMFGVISKFSEEERKNILLYFCKQNSSFEIFKKILFFPSSVLYEGSQVSIIENKIKFIEIIKNELIGIDYIEHRVYLNEKISEMHKEKEKILLDEFLGNEYL